MILSGNVYQAQELYEMGLVDILVEDGEGEMAVYEYIRRENRARNGFRAFRRVRDYANPITLEELMAIVDAWVEAALRLGPRDLRMMERLVARQHHKRSEPDRLIQQAPRRTAKPGKDIELHSGPGAETPSALSAYEA
jgi:DSF synthase